MNWTWFWLAMAAVLLVVQQVRLNRRDDRLRDAGMALMAAGRRTLESNKKVWEDNSDMLNLRRENANLRDMLIDVGLFADPFSIVDGEPPFSPNGRLKSIREITAKVTK